MSETAQRPTAAAGGAVTPAAADTNTIAKTAVQGEVESGTLKVRVTPRRPAAPPSPPGRSPQPGPGSELLGSYRLVKQLGQGGMGTVFLAEDTRLRRPAALKVMLPAVAADPQAKERFLREAR